MRKAKIPFPKNISEANEESPFGYELFVKCAMTITEVYADQNVGTHFMSTDYLRHSGNLNISLVLSDTYHGGKAKNTSER